jgi:hypothetical protein
LQEDEQQDVETDRVLAIDIGLENLATCVTNIGTSFIMDGRKLKSINQYWNKQKAYYQSIADKQGQKKPIGSIVSPARGTIAFRITSARLPVTSSITASTIRLVL